MSATSNNQVPQTSPKASGKQGTRLPYEKPAIIFKGKVTTRAGSPLGPVEEEEFDLLNFLTGRQK